MRITQTNGNGTNGIRGCRIRITLSNGELLDEFVVPSMWGGVNYCKRHPNGAYGKRFYDSWRAASEKEKTLGEQ